MGLDPTLLLGLLERLIGERLSTRPRSPRRPPPCPKTTGGTCRRCRHPSATDAAREYAAGGLPRHPTAWARRDSFRSSSTNPPPRCPTTCAPTAGRRPRRPPPPEPADPTVARPETACGRPADRPTRRPSSSLALASAIDVPIRRANQCAAVRSALPSRHASVSATRAANNDSAAANNRFTSDTTSNKANASGPVYKPGSSSLTHSRDASRTSINSAVSNMCSSLGAVSAPQQPFSSTNFRGLNPRACAPTTPPEDPSTGRAPATRT